MAIDPLPDRFEYFLKLRGLNLTRERTQILEAIRDMARPFSVDDLFFAMHAGGKKTSKATIYRSIQLLLEGRFLIETALSGRQSQYELAEPGQYYGHLVCQHCGRTEEFRGPTMDRFVQEASINNQFLPMATQIKIQGICNDCVKSNPPSLRQNVCVPFLKYEQEREA
jgi:Fur family ferric uptake transcriptional regulator